MIVSDAELDSLITRLEGVSRVGLDTEADSLHCYFEKLCLIQVGFDGQFLLVDPLVGLNLQAFFDALRDKTVIFHGADYDLRLLRRVGIFEPAEIFDTMIAARLCGFTELGLASLVEKFCGVTLCKGSQKANWALRPLSPKMSEYALNDVRYLFPIEEILRQKLRDLGREEWFNESRDRMVATSRETRERDEENAWRISGSALLAPRAMAVLRALWHWRDKEAREWDRPPFHVMGNTDLLEISKKAAANQLFTAPRLPRARAQRFQAALAEGLAVPEEEWPQPRRGVRLRATREQLAELDRIKAHRDKLAKELDLEPSVIASRPALEAFVFKRESNSLMRWQKKLLGLQEEISHAA